ncbi:MAG: hypothetical protein V1808_04395 [Candidatus Daviesbacteria bacterium]
MAKLKKFKQEAWTFYQKWRKEKTYCPALKCNIRISLLGWRHISGATGTKKRTFGDTYRRMKLLSYAKEIIEKSTTVQNITSGKGKTYYALEAMVNVKENNAVSLRKVRVILVEDKNKNKIFYSVMDKKQKK